MKDDVEIEVPIELVEKICIDIIEKYIDGY
jgi:hypothetical protein